MEQPGARPAPNPVFVQTLAAAVSAAPPPMQPAGAMPTVAATAQLQPFTAAVPVQMQGIALPPGAVGQHMVAIAQGELGVSESPPGSNDGPRIQQYRTATEGAAATPGPWCAYFVSWAAATAGAPVGDGGKGTGWVPTLESWGKQNGRYFSEGPPLPGDVVIFDRNGDGLADHTGIVEAVGHDGKIHTIEGNTSGGNVARRQHAPAEISGYVRVG